MDPMTIFWTGNGWAVIDGHHRLRAYRATDWRDDVPVKVFTGSLDEAMGYAGKLNSGEKLPMSNSEKKALAWKLTTCTKLSKECVRLASGMSDGFLSHMRRIHAILLKEKSLAAEGVAAMSWHDAQKQAAGEAPEKEVIDRDAWIEEKAQEMANRILKAIGKQGQQKHEVFARALEIYDSRLPDALREFWDDERGEVERVVDDLDPNPDF